MTHNQAIEGGNSAEFDPEYIGFKSSAEANMQTLFRSRDSLSNGAEIGLSTEMDIFVGENTSLKFLVAGLGFNDNGRL